MKKLIFAAILAVASAGAMAQISISLGQSGYYGHIDLGNLRAPPVIYQEPMLIHRPDHYRQLPPTYLRVPPGHAKKWSKHCAAYDACDRPVYFVQDRWYNDTYAPHYRRSHGDKDRDKDRREFYKEQEKDRREARKEYEKDLKEYDKDRREAYKEREKDRREANKEYEKARKEHYKDH